MAEDLQSMNRLSEDLILLIPQYLTLKELYTIREVSKLFAGSLLTEFRRRFNKRKTIPSFNLDLLGPDVVAYYSGGLALAVLLDEQWEGQHDMDVFCSSSASIDFLGERIEGGEDDPDYQWNGYDVFKTHNTAYNGTRYRFYRTPHNRTGSHVMDLCILDTIHNQVDVMRSFDFSCCAVCFNDKTLYIPDVRNTMNKRTRKVRDLISPFRVHKYTSRGFTILKEMMNFSRHEYLCLPVDK